MASKKLKQIRLRRIVTALLFVSFSSVLFINNLTQLLSTWVNLTYGQINWIAWIGIIGSCIYAIWQVIGGEL